MRFMACSLLVHRLGLVAQPRVEHVAQPVAMRLTDSTTSTMAMPGMVDSQWLSRR